LNNSFIRVSTASGKRRVTTTLRRAVGIQALPFFPNHLPDGMVADEPAGHKNPNPDFTRSEQIEGRQTQ
jgi:hypothetical protein